MSPARKPQKSQGSTFNFENNTISGSSFGDNSSVVNNNGLDPLKVGEFLAGLKEIQHEINQNSESLPKEDVDRLEGEMTVLREQLQNPGKSVPQTVLEALKEVNKILGKFSLGGVVIKKLFDIATTLYGGN